MTKLCSAAASASNLHKPSRAPKTAAVKEVALSSAAHTRSAFAADSVSGAERASLLVAESAPVAAEVKTGISASLSVKESRRVLNSLDPGSLIGALGPVGRFSFDRTREDTTNLVRVVLMHHAQLDSEVAMTSAEAFVASGEAKNLAAFNRILSLLGGVKDLGADNANKLAMNYKFCFVKPPAPGAAGGTVGNGTVASVYDHLEGCGMNDLAMQVSIRKTAVFAVLKG